MGNVEYALLIFHGNRVLTSQTSTRNKRKITTPKLNSTWLGSVNHISLDTLGPANRIFLRLS